MGLEIAMDTLKIETGDWIVVCDGRKAVILENVGDRMFPVLHTMQTLQHRETLTVVQGTDRPGSVVASSGAHSADEQTDWHDESERTFLNELAERLNTAVTSGETTALTMVATPRTLGVIRSVYSLAVRKALHRELAKDLVKMPIGEIEKRLFS